MSARWHEFRSSELTQKPDIVVCTSVITVLLSCNRQENSLRILFQEPAGLAYKDSVEHEQGR